MRLTCPNCGAQYEVPDEVIPVDGRDVQCSNCGHTWYQAHPDHPQPVFEDLTPVEASMADEATFRSEEEVRAAVNDEPWMDDRLAAEDAPPPRRAFEDEDDDLYPEPEEDAEEDFDDEDFDDDDEPGAPIHDAPPRAPLDSAVSDILREEAAREARLREAEAETLESQPELGLDSYDHDDAGERARQARDRMARLRGEDLDDDLDDEDPDADAGETPPAHAARRDLLPDIEEINSTLRTNGGQMMGPSAGNPSPDVLEAPGRSGGMRGFTVALLIGAALLLIYANAPKIAQAVPQADPMLSAYVALVDQARYWLDAKLGGYIPK